MKTPHLTEAQILDCLEPASFELAFRAPDPAADAHLLHCAACRAEVAGLAGSVSALRSAVTGFAAAHPPTSIRQPVAKAEAPSRWAAPALATAALALAVFAVEAPRLHDRRVTEPSLATGGELRPSASDAADDALLQDIHDDLSTSVAPSLQPLALSPVRTNR